MHSYGLFSASEKNIQQHKPIPLQNVKVSAKVIDVISEVTIYQTYKYAESNQSQAIYKFPILPSSAFCDFEVKVDDREIKGIVEEAEQATKEYEEALKNGNIACTIEDQSPDLFYCFVGTILPGQTIEIKLIYVSELQQDTKSEGIRFTLPTAIAPKYNHYSLEKQLEGKNFELENNLNECELESCKIEISVTCRMTSVITSIESPTHATISEVDTNNVRLARVDLNEKIGYLENDFVLVFSSQGLDKPRALVEYNSSTDTNCVMLTLVPQCVPYTGETEFIFIVDVSFSQTLRKCMKALELAIYSLPENSLFNIISQNTYLFPDESQQYSQSTFNAAIEFIQSQQINPNEFTLHSTLQSIFGISDKRSNIPKKIFYITNSYLIIHQFEQLVELFQQQRTINDVSNFFTLFIGDDNSNDICNSFESLTKLGKGYSTFTKCNDAFEINLISIVKNSLEIPLTDYEFHLEDPENIGDVELIDYHDDAIYDEDDIESNHEESSHHLDNSTYIIPNNEDYVEDNHEESSHQLDNSIFLIPNISHNNNHQRPELQQVPAEIPLIYNKQNSVVYFLLEKGIKPPKVISVKAKFQQDLVQFHVTLDPRALKLKFIHTLAAKKFIEENQGKPSVGSNPKIKDQVISLGKMYNLISTYTSFLAINKRGESSTSKEFNNHPISIFHYHKPNYNSSTYFNFKDFTKKNFPPSYTPISTSSELIDLKNLNIHSGLLSRCTDNLTNLISNPVLFVKDSVDEVMNKYSDEKLTLGIRHKHPIYYLGNGMVNSGSAAYQVARKFERFPIFGGLFVKPVVRFIDESVVKKSREELSVEEFDKHFKENLFESHEEMVNPRVVHVETLFSFLKLFSFDGTILDESRFYEFFGKGNSSVLDQMNLTVDDDDVECWLIAISLAYFEIVLWEEFKEESIMCYHKSEKALKQMIKVEDYEDFDEKYNELLEKAREWIKLWIDNVYWH